MKIVSFILVLLFGSAAANAQGVWIEDNWDEVRQYRTGVIRLNGEDYTIGPRASLSGVDLSGAGLGVFLIFNSPRQIPS